MDFAYECRFDILMQGPCQSSLYHSNFIHHISCRGSLPRVGLDHGISDLSVHLNMQLDTLNIWVDTSGHTLVDTWWWTWWTWWTLGGGHLVVDMVDTWWWTLGGGHGGHLVVDMVDTWQTLSRHLVDTCFLDVRTCVGHVWDMFGTCLGHVWKVFGTCLKVFESVWKVLEKVWGDFLNKCLGVVWGVIRTCLRLEWEVFGKSFRSVQEMSGKCLSQQGWQFAKIF